MESVQTLGRAGRIGATAFAGSLSLLHLAATGAIDWPRHYVSDFTNEPLGWVFVFGALVHGLGNLCLTLGLYRCLSCGWPRDGVVALFGLAATGVVIAGVFPPNLGGAATSLAGKVHFAATALSSPVELVAVLLFAAAFRRHRTGTSQRLTLVAALGLAGFFVAVWFDQLPGLAERLALGGSRVGILGRSHSRALGERRLPA
jgi:lysylphosphatidylglycerol synthetase-like protein (DUF2156 family)